MEMVVGCTGEEGATVTFDYSVADALDPDPTVTVTPESGSVFPAGVTTDVMIEAEDASGNLNNVNFPVNVVSRDGCNGCAAAEDPVVYTAWAPPHLNNDMTDVRANAISAGATAGFCYDQGSGEIRLFRWAEDAATAHTIEYIGPVFDNQYDLAVSADGTAIVGQIRQGETQMEAFRWTESDGLQTLGYLPDGNNSEARGVSAAGAVVAGYADNAQGQHEAFRWTESGGMESLGMLPGGSWSRATAVSEDGLVIAGIGDNSQGQQEVFRWTESGGMQGLGRLLEGDVGEPTALNADGSVIIGSANVSFSQNGNTYSGQRVFLWTENTGLGILPLNGENLGLWPDVAVWPKAVSADGSMIVALGGDGYGSFGLVWERGYGWQTLQQRLDSLCMSPPSGLPSLTAIGIVGRTIIGAGDVGELRTFTIGQLPPPPISADMNPPVLAGGGDYVLYDAGNDGEEVCFAGFLRITDDTDSNPQVYFDPPTGSMLPPGETQVQVVAVDAVGNRVVSNFTVTVQSSPLPGSDEVSFMSLGHPDGSSYSSASSISTGGLVAAVTETGAALWSADNGWQTIEAFTPEAISADGSTLVGYTGSSSQAIRWTAVDGMQQLGSLGGFNGSQMNEATGVSADGAVVVGRSLGPHACEAFRWTAESGMQGLGFLPGGLYEDEFYGLIGTSEAKAVSADGTVIVGYSSFTAGQSMEAFRWTAENGMEGLGHLSGYDRSWATAVSADGLSVFGLASDSITSQTMAFRWTRSTGLVALTPIDGGISGVNFLENGAVLVGVDDTLGTVVIWNQEHGWRTLKEILVEYGVNTSCKEGMSSSHGGYAGSFPAIVSGEDILLAGHYYSGNGYEAWLARIPRSTLSEDSIPPEIAGCAEAHTVLSPNGVDAVVEYGDWITVTDDTDPNPVVEFVPPSGSTLAIGDTLVTVSAWDASGNTNTCEFTVTVQSPGPVANQSVVNVREGGEGRFFVRLTARRRPIRR